MICNHLWYVKWFQVIHKLFKFEYLCVLTRIRKKYILPSISITMKLTNDISKQKYESKSRSMDLTKKNYKVHT